MAASLSAIHAAWRAEASAPELLPHATAAYDTLLARLARQVAAVDQARKTGGDDGDTELVLFSAGLYQQEIDRIRFVLAAYTRVRLGKVEKFALHLKAQDARGREVLSDREAEYLDRYVGRTVLLLLLLLYAALLPRRPRRRPGRRPPPPPPRAPTH